LNQSLVKEFRVAVGALPDFLPRFMAFEELPLVEEIDPSFKKFEI
jgi:hypothetical protein